MSGGLFQGGAQIGQQGGQLQGAPGGITPGIGQSAAPGQPQMTPGGPQPAGGGLPGAPQPRPQPAGQGGMPLPLPGGLPVATQPITSLPWHHGGAQQKMAGMSNGMNPNAGMAQAMALQNGQGGAMPAQMQNNLLAFVQAAGAQPQGTPAQPGAMSPQLAQMLASLAAAHQQSGAPGGPPQTQAPPQQPNTGSMPLPTGGPGQ